MKKEPATVSPAAPGSSRPPGPECADFLALLAAPRAEPPWPSAAMFVATCVATRHPTLCGRVRAQWLDPESGAPAQEWWVPTSSGLAIRAGDRLLLSRAAGLSEPIVVAVLDGFAPRPEREPSVGATLQLQSDEVLNVEGSDGQPLLQIRQGQAGPVLRLLEEDARIDVQGRLSISARELVLQARAGNVQLEASDEVNVVAELVKLN